MKITRGLSSISPAPHPVLTIGNFDGQHIGHRALVSSVVRFARQVKGWPMVLSFDPHPIEVLRPDTVPKYLSESHEKSDFFESLGIAEFVVLPFTKDLARSTPQQFVDTVLRDGIGVKDLFVGEHFVFGKGRSGTVKDLMNLGKEARFTVHPMPPLLLDEQIVSSTRIRDCLASGDVAQSARCLGREYQIRGTVVQGEGRGAPMGWPTANVQVPSYRILPEDGIYATRALVRGKWLDSIAYIGTRPTFAGQDRVLEVHIFDKSLRLYGEDFSVRFIDRVRGDKTFNDVNDMIRQMDQDGRHAKKLLLNHPTKTHDRKNSEANPERA